MRCTVMLRKLGNAPSEEERENERGSTGVIASQSCERGREHPALLLNNDGRWGKCSASSDRRGGGQLRMPSKEEFPPNLCSGGPRPALTPAVLYMVTHDRESAGTGIPILSFHPFALCLRPAASAEADGRTKTLFSPHFLPFCRNSCSCSPLS